MATTSISLPGLVGGNSAPARLAVTDNNDGTVSLNTATGGTARVRLFGMVDGDAQSTPIWFTATDEGGGIYTLNAV